MHLASSQVQGTATVQIRHIAFSQDHVEEHSVRRAADDSVAALWRELRKAWRISVCIRSSPVSIRSCPAKSPEERGEAMHSSCSTGVCGRYSETIASSKDRYSSRSKGSERAGSK
jgi:hypothetical protein